MARRKNDGCRRPPAYLCYTTCFVAAQLRRKKEIEENSRRNFFDGYYSYGGLKSGLRRGWDEFKTCPDTTGYEISTRLTGRTMGQDTTFGEG
ncbi:unnamed protein product [Linum trigynum]|uniref:Uncharacterized protein n=1 Tax=Linum trigynum TaxID=586398 RepID=A0AAV2CHG9_9ROSI